MITIIAAIGNNNAIGKNNQLIWHLPTDLKRFKETTLNHFIIMGRKTFESFNKPLPNRTSVIITRNKNYNAPGCLVVNSLSKALEIAKEDSQPFIIGGAEIYKQALEVADKLDLTFLHHNFEADTFFPEIDYTIWEETSRVFNKADENNKYDYSFVTFIRR